MDTFDIEMVIAGLITLAIIIVIAIAIVKIIKAICNAVTESAKIKAFGSSREYAEFQEWKKNRQ